MRTSGRDRTTNSIINFVSGVLGKLIIQIFNFILRSIFIRQLGAEYLGLNGLFSNILQVLSLAELGVGTSIIFALYKPIAESDDEKIAILMKVYKRAYIGIGSVVLLTGVLCTPFLDLFINERPDIPNLEFIYVCFVINSAISYFFSYKAAYITANQKNYIVATNSYIFSFIGMIVQAITLIVYKNYYLYLGVQIATTVATNLAITIIANKMYKVLSIKTKKRLDETTKHDIMSNVAATFLHKIGSVVVFSTDNILLSKLFGLVVVGMYSNYIMVINAVEQILLLFFTAVTASVGNLSVTESKERQQEVYYNVFFVQFCIFSVSSVGLLVLLDSFIKLWIGTEYVMDEILVIFIVLNFYIKGMRQNNMMFNTVYGLARYYKWMPIPECVVNVVASVVIAKFLGPVGILIGTTISSLIAPFWLEPLVLHKYGIGGKQKRYYGMYFLYSVITVLMVITTKCVTSLIPIAGLGGFLIKFVVVILSTVMIICLFFHNTFQFKYVMGLLKKVLVRK